jgi:hypothetical protein
MRWFRYTARFPDGTQITVDIKAEGEAAAEARARKLIAAAVAVAGVDEKDVSVVRVY